jgi:hypothetical protein
MDAFLWSWCRTRTVVWKHCRKKQLFVAMESLVCIDTHGMGNIAGKKRLFVAMESLVCIADTALKPPVDRNNGYACFG